MKKLMIVMAVTAVAAGAYAGPHGCPGPGPRPCGPGWRHPCGPGWGPRPCHRDWWGPGGRNFWPGFVGGVVGGLAYNAITAPCYRETVVVQQPTVVTQPVVVQQPAVVTQPVVVQQPVAQVQNVWVEGCYVDQVQANGSVVRVWNPGHYEQRTVVQ